MAQYNPFDDPQNKPPQFQPPQQQPRIYQSGPQYGLQEPVPNSNAVLVLGIIGIVGCFVYGIPGLICSIIALALAGNGERAYKAEPDRYSLSSYKNLKAGKICAVVGLSLSALFVLYVVFMILTVELNVL